MKEEIRAYFYVGATIILWASVPSVIKFLMGGLSAMQVAFYFLLFGSIALTVVLILQRKAQQIVQFRGSDYLRFLLLGILANYFYHLCFNNSLRFISVSEAITLNYLYPIMIVALASLVLKEKITKIRALGCLLGFAGLFVAITGGQIALPRHSVNLGLALVVLAAFCYALFSVLLLMFKYEVITVMFMSISCLCRSSKFISFSRYGHDHRWEYFVKFKNLKGGTINRLLKRGSKALPPFLIYIVKSLTNIFILLLCK